MYLFLIVFLLLRGSFSLAGSGETFLPVIAHPRGAITHLDPRKQQDLAEALDRVSSALLGRPYELGPLGEGAGTEHPGPLYRTDSFDCTTFVETVMANAYCFRAGTQMGDCLSKHMQKIRYRGNQIQFNERNHIPELDWLPQNVRRGYLEDMSETLFPNEWKVAKATVDRELWLSLHSKAGKKKTSQGVRANPLHYVPVSYFFSKMELSPEAKTALDEKLASTQKEIAAKLEAPDITKEQQEELAKEKFRAEMDFLKAAYVPIMDRINKIPSGTVLNLVRSEVRDSAKAKVTSIISHQGLVIHTKDGAHIRQAAPNVGHVGDSRLASYLLRYLRSANYRGISLYRIIPEK